MAHNPAEWWLEDMPPSIFESGEYEATVAATGNVRGNSGCAWEIRKRASAHVELSNSKRSRSAKSNEQRGYVAAALGVIATFKGPNDLTIYSNSEYVTKGLNGDANRWKEDGWLRADGKPIKNRDLWALIIRLIEERHLTVTGLYESKDSHIPYDRVMALAKRMCERA